MGSKRNVDMSATQDTVKVVEAKEPAAKAEKQADEAAEAKKAAKPAKKASKTGRSKRYVAQKSLIDRSKEYDAFAAVELVKRSSYGRFDATITADINCKSIGNQADLALPHSTGQQRRVAIADDKVLAAIEAGKIEFDVLISTPQMMPKLAKLAPVLGPKGLMPNPKQGTVTSKPEDKKKELEAGSMTVKTERKTPVAHVVIGKSSMDTKHLVENVNALLDVLRGKALKLTLSATMGPGVKVKVG